MNKKTILVALAAAVITVTPFKSVAQTHDKGQAVIEDIVRKVPGYQSAMNAYLQENPQSVHVFQIKYLHALNLFAEGEYMNAEKIFDDVQEDWLRPDQIDEFLFKKAYCKMERGENAQAEKIFREVESRKISDYTAPARYAIGYINYQEKDFAEAERWLKKAEQDNRFADIAAYYILECRFMLNDYKYVTDKGEAMYAAVPEERKPHLARIISESYLVQEDVDNAKKYYELVTGAGEAGKTRADWFYSGSLLYALEDYEGAVANYKNMKDRTDSLGQIANYQMGYSYIQIKNKVAALDVFKEAALVSHDSELTEDAFYNWAKLAFDLNEDTSVFNDYIKAYPAKEQEQRINAYIAVAALYDRDYEGAVNAYDKIDELDEGMVSNYMKANYLRANQLVKNGSYRLAIPCLKAAAYYSDRSSRFNQMSRFWLAESYYRNDQYKEALDVFTDLYNISALYGQKENEVIPYNIAYCHFKNEDYNAALRWFSEYVSESGKTYRQEALVRIADCHFIMRDYKKACLAYDAVLDEYMDVNNIYPYYQAALSYGLAKKPAKKIELLSNVLKASPEAEFYPEALYELGRSYVSGYQDEKAQECFELLAKGVKDSTYMARAYLELGSLARNQSQYNEALGHYKTVVEKMPKSAYVDDALAAIESIYQIKNTPEEYIAYIDGIGKGGTKTEAEKEDMIFNAAEQIFLSENYQKALVSLDAYIDQYPDGRNVYKADFYKAESYRMLGRYDQACDSYRKVIENGEGSFVELSMLNFSDISYRLEHWEDAYGGYSSLRTAALLDNNKYAAIVGMMRSAYRGHKWTDAVKNAEEVIADDRTTAAMASEAMYVQAKAYLATSRRNEAFEILGKMAKDVTGQYGAEAAYLLIQDSYDKGEFEEVENKVYAFSDAGSPQVYWLAKSFIVLGDSFVERGDLEQAKATFESVRDGYEAQSADDDVQDNVAMRLKKLNEMMAQ